MFRRRTQNILVADCRECTFDSYHFESVSFEAIYRVLSPYKNPIGLDFYFEPAVGDQETELEWKVLLQKNWVEDRLVWALNINYELEFEKEADGNPQ